MNRRCGVAVLAVIGSAGSAWAVDYDYIGPDVGNWDTNTNWLNGVVPFGVPGVGDTATITGPDTEVSLNSNTTVDQIILAGGVYLDNRDFNDIYTLTVEGLFSMRNGGGAGTPNSFFLQESGILIDATIGDLDIQVDSQFVLLGQSELRVTGDITTNATGGILAGDGRVFMTDASGSAQFNNNGGFYVANGGVLSLLRDGGAAVFDMDGSNGTGSLQVGNGATLNIELPVTHGFVGQIGLFSDSTLNITNPWTVGGGGLMVFQDTSGGATVATLTGGKLTNQGDIGVLGSGESRAVIEADYEQTVTGRFYVGVDDAAFFLGTTVIRGIFDLDGGGMVDFIGDTTLTGATVTTAAGDEVVFSGATAAAVDLPSTISLDGATLRLRSSVDFGDADSIVITNGGGIVLENDATLDSNGSWTHDSGTLTFDSGVGEKVWITGGQLTNQASIVVDGGSAEIFANYADTVASMVELINGGDLEFGLNSSFTGSFTQTGTGSTLAFDGIQTFNGADLTVGSNLVVFDGTTTINADTDFNVNGGQITSEGNTTINDADAINFGVSGGALYVADGITTINDTASSFDWDGLSGTASTVVDNGAALDINVGQVDLGNDIHNGAIVVAGALDVNVSDNQWDAAGTLQLIDGGRIAGDSIRVTGGFEAIDSGLTSFSLLDANTTFASGSSFTVGQDAGLVVRGDIVFESGSTLDLDDAYAQLTFGPGGNVTFAGPSLVSNGPTIRFNATDVNINASTTFNADVRMNSLNATVASGSTWTLDGEFTAATINIVGEGHVKVLGDFNASSDVDFEDTFISVADFDLGDTNAGRLIIDDTHRLAIRSQSISNNLGGSDAFEDVRAEIFVGQLSELDIDLEGRSSWNLKNNLTFDSNSAVSRVTGDDIVVLSGAQVFGTGTLDTTVFLNSGGLSPGLAGSPVGSLIVSDLDMANGGDLHIDLGGTFAGITHDKITVENHLDLDGVMFVSLLSGYTPLAGDAYDVLDFNTVSGDIFLSLPTITAGLIWEAYDLTTTGTISVEALGDLDNNKALELQDVLAFVLALTDPSGYASLYGIDEDIRGDFTGDGILNFDDITPFADALNLSANQRAALFAAVPEPTTATILLLALCATQARRRRPIG